MRSSQEGGSHGSGGTVRDHAALDVGRVADPSGGRMSDCILWQRALDGAGYGKIHRDGKYWGAHVWTWVTHNGPVPEGKQINHHCDVRICINPEHLYAGTPKENMDDRRARGRARNGWSDTTHCVNGHEFTDENTYYRPDGKGRNCRACLRDRARRRYHQNKEK